MVITLWHFSHSHTAYLETVLIPWSTDSDSVQNEMPHAWWHIRDLKNCLTADNIKFILWHLPGTPLKRIRFVSKRRDHRKLTKWASRRTESEIIQIPYLTPAPITRIRHSTSRPSTINSTIPTSSMWMFYLSHSPTIKDRENHFQMFLFLIDSFQCFIAPSFVK